MRKLILSRFALEHYVLITTILQHSHSIHSTCYASSLEKQGCDESKSSLLSYSSPLQLQKLDTPHELLELVLHHEETTPRLNVLHRTIRAPLIDLSLQVILSEQFRLTQRVPVFEREARVKFS